MTITLWFLVLTSAFSTHILSKFNVEILLHTCTSYLANYYDLFCFWFVLFCVVNVFAGVSTVKCLNSSPPRAEYIIYIYICVDESGEHWFRLWLVAYSAPSHYLNQCWVIVNWALRNRLQWKFNQNTKFFIHENCIWIHRLWNGGHFVQGGGSFD